MARRPLPFQTRDAVVIILGAFFLVPLYSLFCYQYRSGLFAAIFFGAGSLLYYLFHRLLATLIAGKPGAVSTRLLLVLACPPLLIYAIYPICFLFLQWQELSDLLRLMLIALAAFYLGSAVLIGLTTRFGPRPWLVGPAVAAACLVGWWLVGSSEPDPSIDVLKPGRTQAGVVEPVRYRVGIDRTWRDCSALDLDAPLSLSVTPTPGSRLEFELGVLEAQPNASLNLNVLAGDGAGRSTLLSRGPVPLDRVGWRRHDVDLSGLAGVPLGVSIRLSAGDSETAAAPGTALYVTSPRLIAPRTGRPNVIILVFDALRADALGCYGATRTSTPDLDRLARQGIKFERAFSPSSWTCPAVASLLTSRLPSQHHTRPMLDGRHQTLPEILGRDGVRSGAVVGNPLLNVRFNFSKGFQTYTLLSDPEIAWRNPERLIDRGLAWIEENRDAPFFLYLHSMDPHHPYLAPPPGTLKPTGAEKTAVGLELARLLLFSPYLYRTGHMTPRDLTPAETGRLRDRYLAEVEYVSAQAGRFTAELKRRDLWRNTVLIITSDHGETFQEHGYLRHGQDLYLEQIRVPLIVTGGPFETAARTLSQPVTIMDLFPTVLELMGMAIPEGAAGRSLLAALRTGRIEPRPAVSELPVLPDQLLLSLIAGDRHLIRRQHDDPSLPFTLELFDWINDPAEREDLAQLRPEEAAALDRQLSDYLAAFPDRNPQANFMDFENLIKTRMRALGYLK